jgi:hypothetical protein
MNTPTWAEAATAELLFTAVVAMDDEDNDIRDEPECELADTDVIFDSLIKRYKWIPDERETNE